MSYDILFVSKLEDRIMVTVGSDCLPYLDGELGCEMEPKDSIGEAEAVIVGYNIIGWICWYDFNKDSIFSINPKECDIFFSYEEKSADLLPETVEKVEFLRSLGRRPTYAEAAL